MPIYRGLNVAKTMADVDDPIAALASLGLRRADFDLIAGITGADVGVDISDFHNLSNLTVDAKKELNSLRRCVETTITLADLIPDVSTPLFHNIRIDGDKLAGGAIKYKFLNFNNVVANNYRVDEADISTSRLSSWSPMGDAPNQDSYIVYGSDVKVIGDRVGFTSLAVTDEPKPKEFRAEVPTHSVQLQINGQPESFLAMKGIPLSFICNFKDAVLKASALPITDTQGTIPITFKITNLDTGGQTYNSGDNTSANPGSIGVGTLGNPGSYEFSGVDYRRRRVDVYYDPNKIQRLDLNQLEINSLPNVSLPGLKKLFIASNNFSLIPEFRSDGTAAKQGFDGGLGIAPNLEELQMTANNLGRAPDALLGNTSVSADAGSPSKQLNRLPLSINSITMNGCFTDGSQPIDLTDYVNLNYMNLSSDYTGDLHRYLENAQNVSTPRTYDPQTMLSFASSNINVAGFVAVTLQDGPEGLPESGTAVKYNVRVGSDGNLGTAGTSGLTDGDIYYLEWTGGSGKPSGTSTAYYLCTNQNNLSGSRLSLNASGITGLYHSLIRWNVSEGKPYESTVVGLGGIGEYRYNHQRNRRMAPGVMNSPNLRVARFSGGDIQRNAQYPYYDESNKARSSADMAVPRPVSDNFTYYFGEYCEHNIIDFDSHPKLFGYYQYRATIHSDYEPAEKSVVKFKNCPNLDTIHLYDLRNTSGDWEAAGMFKNQPKLRYINFMSWGGGEKSQGRFRDDTFSGSEKIQYMYFTSRFDRYTNDVMGVDGSNATKNMGKWMLNVPKLRRIYCINNYGGGAFMQESDVTPGSQNLDIGNNPDVDMWHFYGSGMRGACPNFFDAFPKMWYFNVGYQAVRQQTSEATSKQVYKINRLYYTSDANYVDDKYYTLADYEAIGWTASQTEDENINDVGIAYGRATQSTPRQGDAFRGRRIVIGGSTPLRYRTGASAKGKRYRIHVLGDTQWDQINSDHTAGKVYKPGDVIRYNNATITGTIAGNTPGEVMPYSWGPMVRGLGLTGLFPQMNTDHRVVYIYGFWNGFIGQFPALTAYRLYRLWMYRNHLTGNIPDLRGCPRLDNIRFENNKISGYNDGAFSNFSRIRSINLSSNNLQSSILGSLVTDLLASYELNPSPNRAPCYVDLRNQGGANPLVEDSKFDGTTGPDSTENKLKSLRSKGWTILLD